MLRASVAAEKAGIPAVSIVATQFISLGHAIAKGLGLNTPAVAEYKGVPLIDSDRQLKENILNSVLPKILSGWSKRTNSDAIRIVSEPAPRDIVFTGSIKDIQDYFERQDWSDGLPVIPPTIAAVELFLKFTDRSSEEVIGICLPEYREATIWNVAVNGVMAGCRPEYMPILIAVVEAVTDPKFFLEDAGATPGWEPLIILSGSIIKELNFNYGAGVMRTGRRANTSVGRFLRLFMRNVPGQRIPPGVTDKACIGYTFNVVLAENEDASAEIGWKSFGTERGFAPGENIVTVQSCVAITSPTYSGGTGARNHVEIISEVIGQAFAYWAFTGIGHTAWYPLIVMSPSVAKAIADDGWSKDDVKHYLYENVKTTASLLEKYARNTAINDFNLKKLVEQGEISRDYYQSDNPDRLVRVFVKPEWIGLVVAGDSGRNQSRGYLQNHRQGVPVSKKINLPRKWDDLQNQPGE